MMRIRLLTRAQAMASLVSLLSLGMASVACAALPAPTPAAQQAAAVKKATADAEAAKQKQLLAESMESLSTRWRSNAGAKGWTTHPPVAIAAAPAAGAAAAGVPAPGPAATAGTAGVPLPGAVPAAVQTTGVATTGTPMPGVAPRATGVSANTLTGTPAGNAAASPGNGAAPRSPQALQSANVPIKSEKLGTATPSQDTKKVQTQSVPKGASPAVDKGNTKKMSGDQ
jgi:hypothetical protein